MIILHASCVADTLHVWAEVSSEWTPPEDSKARKPTRPTGLPRRHPCDGGPRALHWALTVCHNELPPDDRRRRAMGWMVVQVPARGRKAFPSSPHVAPLPGQGKTPLLPNGLLARSVVTRALSPVQAWWYLRRYWRPDPECTDIAHGQDLLWFVQLALLAESLALRESYLPDLQSVNSHYRARWMPVLDGEAEETLARLVERMPDACRCMVRPEDMAGDRPLVAPVDPATLARRFLESLVDALVRPDLVRAELGVDLSSGRGFKRSKVAPPRSAHEAWMRALEGGDGRVEWNDLSQVEALRQQVIQWRRPMSLTTASPFQFCLRLEEPPPPPDAPTDGTAVTAQAQLSDEAAAPHLSSETDPAVAVSAEPMAADGGDGAAGSEAPAGEASQWRLRYLISLRDDPSLQFSPPALRAIHGPLAPGVTHSGPAAREFVLTALGRAAAVCPAIARSMTTLLPEGCALSGDEAYQFLKRHGMELQKVGFRVAAPAWWSGVRPAPMRLNASIKSPPMQASSGLSLSALTQVEWNVVLGDASLSHSELLELARLKAPLVRVRGEWMELNAQQVERAIQALERTRKSRFTVSDAIRMSLIRQTSNNDIPIANVSATGWIGDLLDKLEDRTSFTMLPVPERFEGTLRPYQERGYSWLAFLKQWGLGACLADDMGLGKTIQTLALILRDKLKGEKRPVLLVCPTSVVSNWRKEAERFTPDLKALIHHGMGRSRHKSFIKEVAGYDIVISSYQLLHRDLPFMQEVEWAGIVLDEAQNIKNPQTKQSQAARSLTADYRIALTGTPVENHVGDLWSIMEFLNPGWLGSQEQFKRRFFRPIQTAGDREAAECLKRLTGPFVLRRLKTDRSIISDLPEKLEMKTYCNLTREQASLYAAVLADLEASLEEAQGIQRKGIILSTLTRLKQVCNHPAHFLGDGSRLDQRSGKLSRLEEMLDEALDSGDRALIFTQYAEMGALLQQGLQKRFGGETLYLHGGVARTMRDKMVDRFQNEPDGPRVFVLSLKAGGTGLNLTRANHVFHYDRWWNPSVENQATDRAFRIGQNRQVQVHKFLCAGTLEERIDEMIERKTAVADQVVGAGEGWLTELSNAEIRHLIALDPDATGD